VVTIDRWVLRTYLPPLLGVGLAVALLRPIDGTTWSPTPSAPDEPRGGLDTAPRATQDVP
jgi:hypothetical protein